MVVIGFDCMFVGLQCWDVEGTGVDINEELANVASAAPPGDEGTNGKYADLRCHFHQFTGAWATSASLIH